MEPAIEAFCSALVENRLLPAGQARALLRRWLDQGGQAGVTERFAAWLIQQEVLTEYQAGVVQRGHADQLLLGPYIIQERVGRGRMAGVYRAVHEMGLIVAIKILPPSKAKDATTLARFQREARLALAVKNANVVRTFQTGEAKGLRYLVMEYLEGETFDDLLEARKRLPVSEAASLVHQALQGLQAIHNAGMVHRDLKPANLMLAKNGTVKILDLGMGRALFDDENQPGFDLTKSTDTLGEAAYMSPEQARDAHSANIRSDIYSVGSVFYHLLAGQTPFSSANPVKLLVQKATEEAPPIRSVNPAVPEGLEQILGWMLARDPAKRYPTPARAAAALETFLAGAAGPRTAADPTMNRYLAWLESQTDKTTDFQSADQAEPVKITPVEAIPMVSVELVNPLPPPAKAPPPPPLPRKPAKAEVEERPRPRRRRDQEEEEELAPSANQIMVWMSIGAGGVLVLGILIMVAWLLLR